MIEDPAVKSWVGRIYRESLVKIESLEKRVREGKDLQAALEFGGFILWSGITPLCREFASKPPAGIDGSHLQWRAEELQRQVRERWSNPGMKPIIDETQLEAINRKLDVIAGQIQRYSIGR